MPNFTSTENQILDIVARAAKIDRAKMTPDATLESLGIASVDIVEALMLLEEELNVYISVDQSLSQASDLKTLVATLAKQVEQSKAKQS